MPFDRPTLSELRAGVAADIAAQLPGADALLRFSNLGIIGDVQAAGLNGLYGYLDWIALQAVPFTATGEFLEGWAGLKGVIRKPAVAAAGQATFAAVTGSVVPAGTPVSANGVSFATVGDAAAVAGEVVVQIQAGVAGSAGNLADGAALSLARAISGISSSGLVTGGLAGGADAESDDSLRGRMLAAYRKPPQGGDADDYVAWALEVAGVTRAWAAPNGMGAGTVVVYFMKDGNTAGGFPQGTNGVATAEKRDAAAIGDQLAVANALYDEQPVTALVYAVAPQPNVIAMTIAGLSTASSSTRAAVINAFAAALALGAQPGGTTNISVIEGAIAAIGAAAGFVITGITASAGTVTPGAAGNIISSTGHLPTPGAVTFA